VVVLTVYSALITPPLIPGFTGSPRLLLAHGSNINWMPFLLQN